MSEYQMIADQKLSANLLLFNGKIITVNSTNSIAEAVAIKGDNIIAVGSSKYVLMFKGIKTELIDLKGKTVLPGFIDTHSHPGVAATTFLMINCISPPIKTITEILQMVKEKADISKPGEWIQGINYNQLKPRRKDI